MDNEPSIEMKPTRWFYYPNPLVHSIPGKQEIKIERDRYYTIQYFQPLHLLRNPHNP